MKDYRIVAKVRNARILRRIEALGHDGVPAFCTATGLRYEPIVRYVAMTLSPLNRHGEWRESALNLAGALQCDPEDLFNTRQLMADFNETTITREVDDETLSIGHKEVLAIAAPEDGISQFENRDEVDTLLARLTPRERKIIDWRFGLNGPELTLEECAERDGVSAPRVRQIEIKAIRKMKTPRRSDLSLNTLLQVR